MKYAFSFALFCLCTVFSLNSFADECPSNWQSLHPTWIWCDDFETDKISSYFDNDSPVLLTRSAAVGYNGTYGRTATWTSGQVNAGSLKLAFGKVPAGAANIPAGVDNTTIFRELYYRVYMKSSANWVGQGSGHNSKFTRASSFTAANWSQSMIAHVWSNDTGGNNNYLLSDPASCVTGSTVNCVGYNDFSHLVFLGGTIGTTAVFTSPNTGNWNCIESHVKLNDAGLSNGIQEFWVDGVLNASRTNLNFVGSYTTYGINVILFENYINGGSPQAQSRYWDNLVVSTQRIGCSVSSTAPLPPQNLRIIN